MLKRTSASQQGHNSAEQAEQLKFHSNLLETCAQVYGYRVDSTLEMAKDISSDLERMQQGRKLTKRKVDNNGNGEPDEEVVEQEPYEERRTKDAKKKKGRKKGRRNHVVEDPKELACSETDVNANVNWMNMPVFVDQT